MANITSTGFSKMRDYLMNNWKHIEVLDQANAPILRKDTADARVTWVNNNADGDSVITLQIVLKGSDAEIGVGKQVGGAKLFDVASGGTSLVDVTYATPFEFQNTADELTLKVTIQVPTV